MAVKVSDRALLKAIEKYKDADRICREKRITLKTLQARVARLTYNHQLPNPSIIRGLYQPEAPVVKFSQNAIIIPRTRIEGSAFQTGDTFTVSFDSEKIILTRRSASDSPG